MLLIRIGGGRGALCIMSHARDVKKGRSPVKPSTAYLIGGIIALVCVALGIYYLIPGINHVLADPPQAQHIKHSIVFFALAIVALVGARFAANAKASS
jgi:Ca2+/Na+ antiporter